MTETEWVTIAEAARRLGLAERQARRWADRLPAEARRQEETTPGRSRALVQLAALKHLFEADSDRTGDRTVSGQPAEPAAEMETAVFPVPLALAMTAQREALERVISEQAARICDLQAALDHERGQAKQLAEINFRLTESLAREQTLRMLERPQQQAPAEPMEEGLKMPVEPPDSPQGAGGNGADGLKPPQEPILARIAAFWKRHWY